jgi:thioredoxin-dependent peroxiredoxin
MPKAEPGKRGAVASAARLKLSDQNGDQRSLSDFRGRNLVVYFYPKDDTPGCTIEGREFRDLLDQFAASDTAVVGVSTDSVDSHRAFARKHGLPFVLLSDPAGAMAEAFGVLRDGHAARSTFVLDHELRVRRAFHEVSARGHAREVLGFVRSMIEAHRMLGG